MLSKVNIAKLRQFLSFHCLTKLMLSPEWCFGLLKKKFRQSVVSSLDEIMKVVEESADVNTSQLVGTHDGEVIVPTYDWAGYLCQVFRKLKGIKKYHMFRFSASSPGMFFFTPTSLR